MRVVSVIAAAALLLCAASAEAVGEPVLYSLDGDSDSLLRSVLGAAASVRHVGSGGIVVEGSEELGEDLVGRGVPAARIGRSDRWEVLALCYPRRTAAELSRYGQILWAERDGAVLLGVRASRVEALRSACTSAYPLPVAIPVESWLDDSAPAHLSERTPADDAAVRGLVLDVLDAVSSDSLVAYVGRLCEYPRGELRSRYTLREECLTEGKAYIVDRLRSSLPPGSRIDSLRFHVLGWDCEAGVGDTTAIVEYPADNIVGVLSGNGRLPGYYMVCGHYDATASKTFPDSALWWCDNPAPGADDNGTGVATILETARVLSDIAGASLPFDIHFVLFSGEELGLLGSSVYADSVHAAGDTIYGVINVDMIGYKLQETNPDTCHLVTNTATRWLADWLVTTAEEEYAAEFPDFAAIEVDRPLAYSDHASFWREGYDALVAIEHWSPRHRNPHYHTIGDEPSIVFPSQLTSTTKMVAAGLARMADLEKVNIVVLDSDITQSSEQLYYDVDATIAADVRVFGPSESVDMTVEFWDGEPDEGELLADFEHSGVVGGGELLAFDHLWDLTADDVGGHTIAVRVTTEGTDELTETDNVGRRVLSVSDREGRLAILDHHAFRNPANELSELAFFYELSKDAHSAKIEVFDIVGQRIGVCRCAEAGANGARAGWNEVSWDEFETGGGDPASGIFIYRLQVYEPGVSDPLVETGKFAVVR